MTTNQPKFRGFILGERRSGSNFLRTTLNVSSKISSPHPPHIIHTFTNLVPTYGDLNDDGNWRELVQDVVKSVNLSPVPLLSSDALLTMDEVLNRCDTRSLTAIQDGVYRTVMDHEQKDGWVCKSNDNIHYLEELEEAFGETARYLFLYRDGRDVALSFRKAHIGPKHPYVCAQEWAEIQKQMMEWEDKIGSRVLRVKYETLLANQTEEVTKICDFLGVPFDEAMLNPGKSKEAQRTAGKSDLWKNLDKPIMKNNCGKYLKDDPENIKIYESVAADCLTNLGYELMFQDGTGEYTSQQIDAFWEEDARLCKEAMARWQADGGSRREQVEFLRELRERRGAKASRHSKIAGL